VLNISGQHLRTCSVWMYAVVVKKRPAIPEKVKIVNKPDVLSCLGGLQPGVKTKQSAEASSAAAYSNKNRHSTGL